MVLTKKQQCVEESGGLMRSLRDGERSLISSLLGSNPRHTNQAKGRENEKDSSNSHADGDMSNKWMP